MELIKTRCFVASDFQPISFEAIEPYYNRLLNTDWNAGVDLSLSEGQDEHTKFAKWLADRSELESCLDEHQAWLYVALSCDTENTDKRKAYEFFVDRKSTRLNSSHAITSRMPSSA